MNGRAALLLVGTEIKGTKSDKIRWLLEAGFTRGEIAKALVVKYQMVYQVEQRMGRDIERLNQPKKEYPWIRNM